MITRIEIDGFKSLRDFAVDLEPLTVFIGPNNAGKSNILEAIALLSRLCSQSVDDAFKHGRGRAINQFTRSAGEPGRTIRLAVEVLLPPSVDRHGAPVPNRCRYELTIARRARASGPTEYLGITHESLWVLDRASDTWIASHAELAGHIHHAVEKQCVLEQLGADEQQRHVRLALSDDLDTEWHIPNGTTSLAAPRIGLHAFRLAFSARRARAVAGLQQTPTKPEATYIGSRVADTLSAFHLLHLAPTALRVPSELIGSATLAPDGSNLPAVLANLPASLVGEIRADLVSVVPGLSSFEVVPDGAELRIEFTLTGGEPLPAELTSDGTLRILALLTALRLQPRPSAVAMDELENGIYPGRLRQLIELLQETVALTDASDTGESATAPAGQLPVQLLLTTHSPVMLDAFRSRPSCLRFVDLVRRDRHIATRARSVQPQVGADRGRLTVSLREVDQLLQSADSESASSTGDGA
jgi:predicted ATPase